MNNKRQHRQYRNTPHTASIRYVVIAEGERDDHFLLNDKGSNSWPLVKRSSAEIAEALRKFHNGFAR